MIAGQHITAALKRVVSSAADRRCELNEDDLVLAEPLQKWIGPTVVLECEERLVIIPDYEKVLKDLFSVVQVERYLRQAIISL